MSVQSRRPRVYNNWPFALAPLALTLAGAFSLTSGALAGQGATAGPIVYRGDTAKAAGVTLSAWGSGSITEDTGVIYSGSESLKIVTQGPYQGAVIALDKPVDFGPYVTNKNAYLELALLTATKNGANSPGGGFPGGGFPGGGFPGGGFPGGGFPGGGAGGRGGGGFPGGFPGGGGRGGRGGMNFQVQKAQGIKEIRLVMITSGGKVIEVYLPINSATKDNDWLLLHIPIPAIPRLMADDAQIKEMRIFGDAPAILHLGQVRVVIDETPLTVQRIEEQVVPKNERYRYTASAAAGVMPLKYSWDFDESDGIQEEGEGRSVVHAYYKQGDFIATVTVSDLYGLKPPMTRKFKVHVTP